MVAGGGSGEKRDGQEQPLGQEARARGWWENRRAPPDAPETARAKENWAPRGQGGADAKQRRSAVAGLAGRRKRGRDNRRERAGWLRARAAGSIAPQSGLGGREEIARRR